MIAYLDGSALVKLYVEEPGSTDVQGLVAAAEAVATSTVAYPEAAAAFTRRKREGWLTAAAHAVVKRALLRDWERLFTVPLSPERARRAGDIAELYALRGFDAVHLDAALWLAEGNRPVVFACWDGRLCAAAAQAGLEVVTGPA